MTRPQIKAAVESSGQPAPLVAPASGDLTTGDQKPETASFTLGPWRLAKQPPACGMTVTLYGYGPKTLGTINTGNAEYMANARLIAAAPELYAELRNMLEIYWGEDGDGMLPVPDCIVRARDALAKAEGKQ